MNNNLATDNPEAYRDHRRRFNPGATLFREGEAGECAYIIERGHVVITSLVNGRNLRLAVLGPGEIVGEMALVDRGVRTATATARDAVEAIVVSHDLIHNRIDDADPVLNLFLRVILSRFREWRERISLNRPVGDRPAAPADKGDAELAIEVIRLNEELRSSLGEHRFTLFFQPIVALNSHRIAGFEALVRWLHPERGLVPPNEFIGLAEASGLIVPLGLEVLRSACSALKHLNERQQSLRPGAQPLFMSVNLSARQLDEPEFITQLYGIIEEVGLSPHLLRLEITESLLMRDPERASVALAQVQRLGFGITIDDFGTGYSSLSYLHRFPIDTLKIDRSFVHAMLGSHRSLTVVQTIGRLAQSLGLNIVAEGIETPEQLEYLQAFGFQYGQGYLIGRPAAEDVAHCWVEAPPEF